MDDPDSTGMFQGSELSKLLILLAIALGGWVAVWFYLMKPHAAPPEPWQVISGKPRAIETDRSPEFESVTDKTVISLRDMAAYTKLLAEAREAKPAVLTAKARRDVFYAHLWGDPKEYRGVPIRLEGTARRVLYYASKLSKTGWLYETWMFTPDGQGQPFVCISEEAPQGYPVGTNLQERIAFNGYFLKLMRYEAGDVPRAAPLLVGRIDWAKPPIVAESNQQYYWMVGVLAFMFLICLARWIRQFRLSLAPKPPPSILRDRPIEDIDPESLSDFLVNLPDDELDHELEHDGHR